MSWPVIDKTYAVARITYYFACGSKAFHDLFCLRQQGISRLSVFVFPRGARKNENKQ
jgi:hypothetical protein